MTPRTPPDKTILVVEDNDTARDGLAVVLRQQGYRVVPVGDGQEALGHLAAGPAPDLILLDMLMPGLDGWHFLGCQPRAATPVIVMTATTVIGRDWAESHGCLGYLRKPFETDDLLREVERCLA